MHIYARFMQQARVGIFGGSGYSGLELTRLIARHSKAELSFATSDRWVGQPVAAHAEIASSVSYVTVEQGLELAASCDSVLLATPAKSSLELVPKLRAKGVRVIDLAGTFRLKNGSLYPAHYQFDHSASAQLVESVYGLPELFRERTRGQALIANPGCFATVAALTVAPLIQAGLIEPGSIVINGASGVSGAGRRAAEEYGFMEIDGDYRAYRVLKHQHTPEIDQTLSVLAGEPVTVVFTPHLLPIKRGILCTSVATLKPGAGQQQVTRAFETAFAREPFIKLAASPDAVRITDAAYTNKCIVSAAASGNRVVSIGAIDNLLKGAASQAIQNLNLQLGFDETEGLV